ncbi:hypothetical protein F5148DRAFT_1370914 [Russula earlei]|uniref:Uncharacterized protein n=1 Tax=Russula earlei TaxID=71964 RepID=A0ACC0TV12_9AGAM|nr:hypothetical protein F5148DRAFT_1370914 [Russula earlei]
MGSAVVTMFLPLLYLLYGGNGSKSEGGGERGWRCQRVRVMGDRGNGEEGEGGGKMAGSSLQQVAVGHVDDSVQVGDETRGGGWCARECVISVQKQDVNGSLVVAAHVDEGVCVSREAMEGEVLCSVVLASAASPVMMAWWWGLMFFLQGGMLFVFWLFVHSFLALVMEVRGWHGQEGGRWLGLDPEWRQTRLRVWWQWLIELGLIEAAGGAKMSVGEAEAMGVVVHKTRTGVATGDIEVVGNAEAETGSMEVVADVAGEETSEGTVADKTGAAMGDVEAVAGNASDTYS